MKQLKLYLVVLLTTSWISTTLAESTLLQLLQANKNVSKFSGYVSEVPTKFLNETGKFTLIAPNNAAINRISSFFDWNSLDDMKKMILIMRHVIPNTALTTNSWTRSGQNMKLRDIGFGTGHLHQTKIHDEIFAFQTDTGIKKAHYINRAMVVEPDLPASNGMMQVVDEILYDPYSENHFLAFLANPPLKPSLSKSVKLWFQMVMMIKPKVNYATYFMVTDEGWSKVPAERMKELEENSALLYEVLAHHFAPNQLLFSEWTKEQLTISIFTGVPTEGGRANLKEAKFFRTIDGKLSVSSGGGTANLVDRSLLVGDGIIHFIDSPLGFYYETREQIVQRLNAPLLQECRVNKLCSGLLASPDELTIFVPTTEAMQYFNALSAENKTTYLQYLFIKGRWSRAQMTDYRTLTINGLPNGIRFRTKHQNIFVEGYREGHGYVQAQLVKIDQQATNGIVHQINAIPALPTKTVEEYLNSHTEYSLYREYGFVEQMKLGAPYTFLVPSNEALNAMKRDSVVGNKLLQDDKRRMFIFRRHSFPMGLLINALSPAYVYNVTTANYAFTREMVQMKLSEINGGRVASLSYNGQTIDIDTTTGSYEFTNGWLYEITRLMYTTADLTTNMCTSPGCP